LFGNRIEEVIIGVPVFLVAAWQEW